MLVSFLRPSHDIFAWKPVHMPGVPKELIEHCLKVDPNATPKKQRLWRFTPDKMEAIKKELAKLLVASFIKHLEWLANPVPVLKKNNNEWRMCVDYTDLNKHCPKDVILSQVTKVDLRGNFGCFSGCYLFNYFSINLSQKRGFKFTTPICP
jgi:hypothetical protein